LRDPKLIGEGVDPENPEEYHLDDHARRKLVERCHVIRASNPFFCGPNTLLNVGNVFIFAANVEFRFENCRHITVGAFKLRVTKNISDLESAFTIDVMDSLEAFDERCVLLIVEDFSGNKTDVPRDGEEKRNRLDKHDVDAEGYVPIV
jgi:hypothetical protein